MFDKNIFKSNVSGIVAKVSEKTHEAVEAIVTDADGDAVNVIAKKTKQLKHLALALSDADYIVSYVDGCNFIRVQPNPCPTPRTYTITHIPVSFAQAIQLVKTAGFAVVEDVRNGVPHATAIGIGADYDALTKVIYKLSEGGIRVTYYGCGPFFEFDDAQAKSPTEEATAAMEVSIVSAV